MRGGFEDALLEEVCRGGMEIADVFDGELDANDGKLAMIGHRGIVREKVFSPQ